MAPADFDALRRRAAGTTAASGTPEVH
jgi:hypothetical protein